VDEAVIAEIDANVREVEAAGIEEHEIAGPQLVEADAIADAREIARGARQRDAGHLLEHVLDETAAVETGAR
jgi:hypothetical protein